MPLSRRLFRYWFLGSLVWMLFWGRQQDILCIDAPGQKQTIFMCGDKTNLAAFDWHETAQLIFGGPIVAGAAIFLAYWAFQYLQTSR